MTTNPTGEEWPRESADEASSATRSREEALLERQDVIERYQGRFPVVINVFNDYFVSSDKSLDFLEKYQKQGEARAEFEGLAEEIRDAIRNPKDSTPLVNAVLGSALSQQESRSMLSELLDQMLEQGDFSPQVIEETEAEERARRKRPDPDDMFTYYARRKFAIPLKSLRQYQFPLWAWLAGSGAVFLFGLGIGYIPWPDFMRWFPITFLALGGLGIAFCLVAMLGLRDEVLNPDREADREKEKREYKAKKEQKEANKESLTSRIRRTLS